MSKAPIPFRGFDEEGQVRIYAHGTLPHWRQQGCTYFVTVRLADSIPAPVLREHEYERSTWLKARGIRTDDPQWKQHFARLPATEQRLYERLLGQLVNSALDKCHGSCVLRDQNAAKIVAGALDHFHGTRVYTGDYVVMPNHVHVLLTPIGDNELEDILHSIKSYTANAINRLLDRSESFWQRDSYDHIVRDVEQLEAFQNYIASNPAKAHLTIDETIYSTAMYQIDCK